MKCVILAAGRGTRMGELCADIPKPMLPIKGRPKLAYTLDGLPDEIDEVIFVVGYLREQIKDYFGSEHMGRAISYVEQVDLNGTDGALRLTAPLMDEEKFLVLNGDDLYVKGDLEKMLQYDFSVLAYDTDYAEQYGYLEQYNDGILKRITDRPHNYKSGTVNAGAYVVSTEYFDHVPVLHEALGEYGIPEVLTSAYPEIKTHVVVTKKWFPIGDPDNYAEAANVIHDFL